MKRTGAVALALLYALPSTWVLQGGVDLLRPPRVAASSDGKCAPHGCGCDESARVRQACCCAPTDGPATALQASRCSGTEAAALALLTPPALPGESPLLPAVLVSRLEFPHTRPLQPLGSDRTDKVPIA
jgi:hypothetical protein